MPEQDLDARIKQLVARAVDEAPPAPDLEGAVVLESRTPRRPDRRAWWIGGGAAALAAAAAVVTAVVLVNDTDDRVSTPATTPTAPPSVVETVAPTTAPPATAPATAPTTATPAPAVPSGIADARSVVTAGADGVAVLVDGVEVHRDPTPAVRALLAPDGSLLVERPPDDGEAFPQIIRPDGSVEELLPGLNGGATYRLHDVATIDGVPVLLYGVVGVDLAETLYVSSLVDDPPRTEVGTFEPAAPPLRLSMADTGTIVGTVWDASGASLFVTVVPGSPDDDPPERPGSMLDAAVLGLGATCPGDITLCPGAFTISSDGSLVAWVDRSELVTHDVATGAEERTEVPGLAGSAPLNGLDVRRLADGTLEAAVSSELGDAGEGSPDELVRVSPAGEISQTTYFSTLTLSPYAVATTAPEPEPTTPTGLHVTASPDDVIVWDDRTLVRQLDQPATIAVLLPGGSVVLQPPSPDPRSGPSELLVWRPDGTVERFLPALPPDRSYRLHDAAVIAGTPTVLYGVSTRDLDIDEANPGQTVDPTLFTEVLHAVRLDPAGWVDAEVDTVSTWEGGWSRLSVSDQGLVVGMHGESVSTALYSTIVPGSPAVPVTAAALGVEPQYSECDECPGHFTVSPDGTIVAWVEGSDLVARTIATGEVRRWTLAALTGWPFSELDVRTGADGAVEAIVNTGNGDADAVDTARFVLGPDGRVQEEPVDAPFASFGP